MGRPVRSVDMFAKLDTHNLASMVMYDGNDYLGACGEPNGEKVTVYL